MPNQHRYDIPEGTIDIEDKDLKAIRQRTEAKRIRGLADGFLTQVSRRPLTSFSPAELDLLLASCEFSDFSAQLSEERGLADVVEVTVSIGIMVVIIAFVYAHFQVAERQASLFTTDFLGAISVAMLATVGGLSIHTLKKKLASMSEQSSFRGVVLDHQALNLDEISDFVDSDANTAHLNRLQQIVTATAKLVDEEIKSGRTMGLTLEQAPVFAQAVAANLNRDQRNFLRSELEHRQKKVAPTSPAVDDQSSGQENDQDRLTELYYRSIRQRHAALSSNESR